MNKDSFTDEDLKMYTAALNFIALNAKFGEMDIKSIIECRNHFAHLQAMAAKMDKHVLEVKALHKKKEKKDK